MSSLVVRVCTIDEIKPHPNADLLEIAVVGGWQCIVPKGKHATGDLVVYFPPDTLIPRALSDALDVTRYLAGCNVENFGRIHCTKLRGEPSFGLVIPAESKHVLGDDVAEYYGAQKYTPPPKFSAGDSETSHLLFTAYTDIENLRNFPEVFQPGEMVSVTEKIHGTNCRVGFVDGELMAGSHKLRRKEPPDYAASTYWLPASLKSLQTLLAFYGTAHKQTILYGEVFGPGVQNLHYGLKSRSFRAFDLLIDGKYMDVDDFQTACRNFGVDVVPEIARIPFELEAIRNLSEGPAFNGGHRREGVVVKPLIERTHPDVGRVVFKYISDSYLLGRKEDFTDA